MCHSDPLNVMLNKPIVFIHIRSKSDNIRQLNSEIKRRLLASKLLSELKIFDLLLSDPSWSKGITTDLSQRLFLSTIKYSVALDIERHHIYERTSIEARFSIQINSHDIRSCLSWCSLATPRLDIIIYCTCWKWAVDR